MHGIDDVKPSTGGGLIKSFSVESPQMDQDRMDFGEKGIQTFEMTNGSKDAFADSGPFEPNGAVIHNEHEKSNDDGTDPMEGAKKGLRIRTSPVDEKDYFVSEATNQLKKASASIEEMENKLQVKEMAGDAVLKGILTAMERSVSQTPPIDERDLFVSEAVNELEKVSDAIEEMEHKVQVKEMVFDAVLKGMLTAIERDLSEAVETKETELQKVKDQLQEKDSILNRILNTLQEDDKIEKLFGESNQKEKRFVADMLAERERVFAQAKESETFMIIKEKELLKMAGSMGELALKLDMESRKVTQLEKQLKESKESEASKGRELMAMMEKAEQFTSKKESTVEMVRREGRLKELRLTDSLAEKDKLLSDQTHRITFLESAGKQLRDELQVQVELVSQFTQTGKDDPDFLKKRKFDGRMVNSWDDDIKDLKRLTSLTPEKFTRKSEVLETSLKTERSSREPENISTKAEVKETKQPKHVVQDEEFHSQKTVSHSEQHPREELSKVTAYLNECTEAVSSLKLEMEDQSWKHEIETGLIVEAMKEKVVALIEVLQISTEVKTENSTVTSENNSNKAELKETKEQNHVVQDVEVHRQETVSHSEDHLRQELLKMSAYLQECAEAVFSLKVEMEDQSWKHEIETDVVIEAIKEKVVALIEVLKRSTELQTENSTCTSEHGSNEAEATNHVVQDEETSEYGSSKAEAGTNHVVHDEEVQSQETFSHSEQHLRQELSKVSACLQESTEAIFSLKREMEEESWKHEIETGLITEAMKEQIVALIEEAKGYASELVQMRMELQNGSSESDKEKSIVTENQKDMDSPTEEKGILSVEESVEILQKLEDIDWRSQAQTAIILGLVEGSIQEYAREFAQLREELKLKHEEVLSLHSEVEGQRERLTSDTTQLWEELKSKDEEVLSLRSEVEEQKERLTSNTTQLREELNLKNEEALSLRSEVEEQEEKMTSDTTQLREELKIKDEEVLSLRSEVEEQKERLTSSVSEVSDLKAAVSSKDLELLDFRQQQEALVEQQKTIKEIEDLKKLIGVFLARLEEEKQRVRQLEEALNEQKFRSQVDLEMVTTVLCGSRTQALPGEEQIQRELDGQKPADKLSSGESLDNAHGGLNVEFSPGTLQCEAANPGARDIKKIATVEADRVTLLEWQNHELRREKEQLLEQKTEEIYKLKREFYKELERIKGEQKSNAADLLALRGGKEISKSVGTEMDLMDDQDRDSDNGDTWNSEKSKLLESISQRDEQIKERDERIKDIATKLSNAIEKERTHVSTKASLVENLAALEKERNRLNAVHEREKEKLITNYKNLLKEKDTALTRATEEIEVEKRHSGEVGVEIAYLRTQMGVIHKHLKRILEQAQHLMGSSEHLEKEVFGRLKKDRIKLDSAQRQVKNLFDQYRVLSLSETELMQNVENLQKAEQEVDMLGDEVDALMDLLEKVYSVLNHYSPIIQLYPGLAELVKVVRQEILNRISDSDESECKLLKN